MGYMIFLAKEKDIGKGCYECRFCTGEKCMADERVNVYRNGELSKCRPYCCPFRYFDSEISQITDRLDQMTKEETKGWFKGADFEHRRYIALEEERDRFVASQIKKT